MEFTENDGNKQKIDDETSQITVNDEQEDGNGIIQGQLCSTAKVEPKDRIIFPHDVIDIATDDDMIYIIGPKDGKVTKMGGFENMPNLQSIVLRSCLISTMEGLETLVQLEKLELYDNHIEYLQQLNYLTNLKILDLSFNAIRSMSPVASCVFLEELYLAQNKLRKMEGLNGLTKLRVLDLGANRIRQIEGLENCVALKSLWLGKNKIEVIEGLDSLECLTQLDIQNNRLTSFGTGLSNLRNLSELYLACNEIGSIDGLPLHQSLSTIDLSTNKITSLKGIELQPQLVELWLSRNLVASMDDIMPLTLLSSLRCLYLEQNPLAQGQDIKAFRSIILSLLPHLEEFDAVLVDRKKNLVTSSGETQKK